MAEGIDSVMSDLEDHIAKSEDLQRRCLQHKSVDGISKLVRKIEAEIKFLKRLRKKESKSIIMQLKSTNLNNLQALVEKVETLPHVTHVLKRFQLNDTDSWVLVDIICNHGHTWVKVITRKAEALHRVWAGDGDYGDRNLIEQAMMYRKCVEMYPIQFQRPQLLFFLCRGVSSEMKKVLESNDISVKGEEMTINLKFTKNTQNPYVNNGEPSINICDKNSDISSNLEKMSYEKLLCDNEDSSDSDSDEELLTATALLQRQRGQHDLPAYINQRGTSDKQHMKSSSTNRKIRILKHKMECSLLNEDKIDGDSSNRENNYKHVCSENQNSRLAEKHDSDKSQVLSQTNVQRSLESHTLTSVELVKRETYDSRQLQNSINVAESMLFTPNEIKRLNLDITTMISYVSNLCNGYSKYRFEYPFIAWQAERERDVSTLLILNKYFEGKELYACETALADFKHILSTAGGPSERARAESFLKRVKVIADDPSARVMQLHHSAHIKPRAKVIFGTGDTIKAVTVTANCGFVRSAEHQHVHIPVLLHESRALTEKIQANTCALDES